jgi:PAS domain S-box-containing protein
VNNNKTAGRWSPTSIGVNLAIVAFNAVLIAAVWIAALEVERTDREKTISAAIERNDNLAIAFKEYTTRTIESADAVIRYMIREYLRHGSRFDIDQFVADYTIENKAFTGVVLADENGKVATTAYQGKPAKPANVADREHFKVHLTQDTGKLFVGKPVIGRVRGKLVIPLTRRINKPDGSFGGVAMVLIEPGRFTDLLDDAKLKNIDIINLIGTDGIIRARLKGTTTTAGEDVSRSPVFKAYISRPNGHYFAKSQVDGIAKFFSYRTLADYQLIAEVAAAEGDVLADFFHRRRHYFGAAGIACVLIASFSLLLIVSLERQRRATASVARSQARFLATFDQAAVGIAHTDLDGRCLEANQKLCDITGYAREELLGRKFTDITHPDDVEDSNRFRHRVVRESNTFNSLQREKRYIRKDGSIVWCLLTTSVVRDKSGNIDYLAAVIQDITEQKKTEQARAQLAAIVESSNDAIISRSLDGTIASWNKSAERMFGWTATEIIGKPIQTLSPPDRRGNFLHVLEQVKRGEIAEPYDTERVRKDGTRFDARVSLSAVKDTAGHVTGIAIIVRDITDRKHAEQAQAQLAAIVESSNDAIISHDLNRIIISWNPAAERLFGWTTAEALGQSARIIIPPERALELEPLVQQLLKDEIVAPVDAWRVRKDGSRFEAQISYSAIRNSKGKITAIAIIIRDITERREKEAIAQKEKQFSDSMIESMPGIVYFYNEQGRFLRWNENFARVSGYTSEEIAQMHPLDFFGGAEKKLLGSKIKEVFEQGESSVEASFLLKNGSVIPYFFTGKRVIYDGTVCLVGMGIDIHERKQAETALRDYAAQMRHLSWRLSEVEERERRNIHRELHDQVGANLAALKLDLGLINGLLSSGDRKTAGDRLQKAQQLAGETVEQIRDVMGNLRPPALDDYGLLAALRNYAEPYSARLGIPVMVDGDDIQPRLTIAVETALFRIAQEALNNIAKHAQARHVVITITMRDNGVTLVVADDGVGFAPDQANPQRTVWGLRTMRERAQAIAAGFRVESSPGNGTRIIVEVPREEA